MSLSMVAIGPMLVEPDVRSRPSPHVLTLTPFYPVREDEAQGCYVSEPLRQAERCGVVNSVIAVRPFYYGRASAHVEAVPAHWSHFFSLPGGWGLSSAGAFLFAGILRQVRALHGRKPIDVIHAHAPLPCGHAAALLSRELGIPFVVTVHGLDAFSTRQVRGRAGGWCRRVSRWVYGSAAQVICISEKVREQVLEGAGPVNTTVIYNGVDPERFFPPPSAPEQQVLLSVGTLIPTKGHDLLLQAFAAIQPQFPNLSCQIIGEGPSRPRLSALAAELKIADKARLPGRQTRAQVAEAMRRCTVFVLPSRYEGLGCVYLEAMSAERPVIACRGQGIEEVILHGRNGWLVDPGDPAGLTGALAALLGDAPLRSEMGESARRTVLNGLTLAHQAERLARIYGECMR